MTNSATAAAARTTASTAGEPRLRPGVILSRRYQVVRFIARGGMGEVYAVEDLELRQQIALKTISPERANEPGARERFRREVQLSRRVTHPNVCRLFDVGFHEDDQHGPIIFLTMELLEGETLAARLAKAGRLPPSVALPIVEQIAAALDAAHAAGVVHCDFKPHNVVLVARGDGQPPRVVVTDFGLARALGPESAGPTGSLEERMFGTPAYMAPEQVRGRAVTARSDLYSLGVALFQIATGQLPFVGSTSRETASLRLTRPPAAPRDLVPDLDHRWEKVILQCLEREPERRPARAEEVARQLRAHRRPTRRAWAVGLALTALMASTLLTWAVARRRSVERPHAGRRSLAVVGWSDRDAHPDQAWIGTALAVLLGDELAAGDELRLARPDEVTRAHRELSARPGSVLDANRLAELRADLDVDDTVSGSYALEGSRLAVSLRVVDAAGRDVLTLTDGAPLDQLRPMAARLGARVRRHFGVRPTPADERRRLDASLPASPEVIRLYAEGRACAIVYEFGCAVDRLNEVVKREPQFVMAHSALSDAYRALNKPPLALAEAKTAFDSAASLPREQRILVEAVYRTRARQFDEGIKLYQALATFYPDEVQYALAAIEFTCQAGRCADALQALEQLRRSAMVAPDDARIDLREAQAALRTAEYQRAVAAARRAADKARRRGARLLLADALQYESGGLEHLGSELETARAACDEAFEIFRAAGDRGRMAGALTSKGNLAKSSGDLDGARAAYEQATAIYRALGAMGGVSTALGNLATVLRRQGKLDEARRALEECIAIDRTEKLELDEAVDLSNLGHVLHDAGDRAGARARDEEALAVSRKIGSLRRSGPYTIADLGLLAFEGGQLDEAERDYNQSLALFVESKDTSGEADLLNSLAGIALQRDRFAEARALVARARALSHVAGADTDANNQVTTAMVAIADRHLDEAERLTREASETLRRQKHEDEQVALATLAEALVEDGKLDEARATVARARQLIAPGVDARLALAITEARLSATTDAARGLGALIAARDEARRLGLVGRELWARLYASRLQLATARATARAELRALGREARAHQLTWLARLAAAQ